MLQPSSCRRSLARVLPPPAYAGMNAALRSLALHRLSSHPDPFFDSSLPLPAFDDPPLEFLRNLALRIWAGRIPTRLGPRERYFPSYAFFSAAMSSLFMFI